MTLGLLHVQVVVQCVSNKVIGILDIKLLQGPPSCDGDSENDLDCGRCNHQAKSSVKIVVGRR